MNDLKSIYQITSNSHNRFEADHIYVDCNIINNDLLKCSPKPLVYNQTKSSNIINDCSEYHCSVVRFQMDSILPVIIPNMETEQNTGGIPTPYQDRTTYVMNMGYGVDIDHLTLVNGTVGTSAEGEFVLFQPDNLNTTLFPNYFIPTILPISQIDVINNPYFWISSIKAFLNMLNKALLKLFLRAKVLLYPTQLAKATAPEFIWNTATQKIDLIVSKEFLSSNITPPENSFYISVNAPLQALLNTFSFTVSSQYRVNNFRDGVPFFFNLIANSGISTITVPINTPPTPADGTLLYRFESEASSVPSWSPVSSIVFSSYTIPVNSSEAGVPEFLGKSPYGSNSANNIVNELTDFEIQQTIGTELSNSILYYSPPGEYRLFSLNSNQSINKINIQVNWLSKYGSYVPFYLNYNGSASLKLMFRKKNYNMIDLN